VRAEVTASALREGIFAILRSRDAGDALDHFRRSLGPLAERSSVFLLGPGGEARASSPARISPPHLPEPATPGSWTRFDLADGVSALLIELPHQLGTLSLVGEDLADPPAAERAMDALVQRLTEHRRLEELLAERNLLRQRAEESEALHTLALAANRSLDLDEVLALVARFARSLLGASYVAIHIAEGEEVRTAAAAGLTGEGGQPGTIDPFAVRVVREGRPLAAEEVPECVGSSSIHGDQQMRTGLGVPLGLFGDTFGALVIGYRRSYPLSPRDTRLALTLAGHAAVAISNARLHRTIADRSRDLELAYRELHWSATAKERFFASMSHELRTPLNAIIGYLSLLVDGVVGPVPEEQRPFLENASRASRSLLTLVNDVLDLAKIEAGKLDLEEAPVEVNAILDEVLATLRPLADTKGLEIRKKVSPTGGFTFRTDPARLRQILTNLLSNAVKFTETGSVELESRVVGSRPGRAEFRVRDTGPGVPPEDRERVFLEFEQLQGPGRHGGTGLGLAISRRLARLLGGDLTIESAPEPGATFVLSLPLSRGTAVASENM
jgi:signal transduction histidine kinase